MAGSGEQQIVKLIKDTTLRWSCRRGDYVLWLQFSDPIAEQSLGMVDLWEMRDGDFVTITTAPMTCLLRLNYIPPKFAMPWPTRWQLSSRKATSLLMNPLMAQTSGVSNRATAWHGLGTRVQAKKPSTEYWQLWTAGNVVWPSEKPTEAVSRILWRSVRHRSPRRVPKTWCVARLP